jgi:hypothetical protein
MGMSRTAALSATVVLALVAASFAMAALLTVSEKVEAAPLTTADWQMNEASGQMFDSSANGNDGSPTDVLQTGSNYTFNGSTSRVAVPDNDSLDPLERDITLRAQILVPDAPMDDDSYDIVRKGLSATPGGDYKMEVMRTSDPTIGQLHCLFKGTGGRVSKVARPDIVDGNWHTLECVKTSDSVVARVDGRSYTKTGSAGSISNPKEVLVGAKTTNPFDDVFEGLMDFVSIEIAADTTPPETTLTEKPSAFSDNVSPRFSFESSEGNSTFECSLDGRSFSRCFTPRYYSSLSQGKHTFGVRATDALGNTDATPATYIWTVDTVGPSGTVVINGDRATTSSRSVTLRLSATDPAPGSGVAFMRLKNGGAAAFTAWQPYARSKAWSLSSGAGKKIVYVQYRDRAGNISTTATDSITYRP